MNRKHTVSIGVGTGLVVGIIMFGIALLLRNNHVWLFRETFYLIHAPALRFLVGLHESAYDWNTTVGYLQILAVLLIYWTLLGSLAGLSWQTYLRWKHRHHVA
jgi:hypothetical protein